MCVITVKAKQKVISNLDLLKNVFLKTIITTQHNLPNFIRLAKYIGKRLKKHKAGASLTGSSQGITLKTV